MVDEAALERHKMYAERSAVIEKSIDDRLRALAAAGNPIALEVAEIASEFEGIPIIGVTIMLLHGLTRLLPPQDVGHMNSSDVLEMTGSCNLWLMYVAKSGGAKNALADSCRHPSRHPH